MQGADVIQSTCVPGQDGQQVTYTYRVHSIRGCTPFAYLLHQARPLSLEPKRFLCTLCAAGPACDKETSGARACVFLSVEDPKPKPETRNPKPLTLNETSGTQGCVFLSVEDQERLEYKIHALLPFNRYERKMMGES